MAEPVKKRAVSHKLGVLVVACGRYLKSGSGAAGLSALLISLITARDVVLYLWYKYVDVCLSEEFVIPTVRDSH